MQAERRQAERLAEQPTRPQIDLSKISTTPPRRKRTTHETDTPSNVPTMPPPAHLLHRHTPLPAVNEPVAAQLARGQRAANYRTRSTKRFRPLDGLRWWLVRPGHIESLCWTGGLLLLFTLSCFCFYFVMASTSSLTPTVASSRPASPQQETGNVQIQSTTSVNISQPSEANTSSNPLANTQPSTDPWPTLLILSLIGYMLSLVLLAVALFLTRRTKQVNQQSP
jgi:hypothetical protein